MYCVQVQSKYLNKNPIPCIKSYQSHDFHFHFILCIEYNITSHVMNPNPIQRIESNILSYVLNPMPSPMIFYCVKVILYITTKHSFSCNESNSFLKNWIQHPFLCNESNSFPKNWIKHRFLCIGSNIKIPSHDKNLMSYPMIKYPMSYPMIRILCPIPWYPHLISIFFSNFNPTSYLMKRLIPYPSNILSHVKNPTHFMFEMKFLFHVPIPNPIQRFESNIPSHELNPTSYPMISFIFLSLFGSNVLSHDFHYLPIFILIQHPIQCFPTLSKWTNIEGDKKKIG